MGKASKRKQTRREMPPDAHLPDPNRHIQPWMNDPATMQVQPARAAEFWRASPGRRVACDLCYRRCELQPGEHGWCGYRFNLNGRMQLGKHAHGVVSCMVRQQRGYQVDPFLTYKPGATSLFIGGTHCTAGCVFCMSKEITWQPERVPWLRGEMGGATDAPLYEGRAVIHPGGVIELARQWGCSQIEFGINEPLLSWEFTFDVARLAKRAGLDVVVETNGFSTPAAVDHLAPFVDAVDVGIKGHLDPGFYAKRMRSGEAPEAVKAAILAWKRAGVHLIIGDLVPPPRWMTDDEAETAARALYRWIADEVGPQTPVLITQIMTPGPQVSGERMKFGGLLLGRDATADDEQHYNWRRVRALAIARECGLVYAHPKDGTPICCHACGGILLHIPDPCMLCNPCTMPTNFCSIWTHEQHVTDSRCDHCGVAVPIQTLSADELAATWEQVAQSAQHARSERYLKVYTRDGEELRPWADPREAEAS